MRMMQPVMILSTLLAFLVLPIVPTAVSATPIKGKIIGEITDAATSEPLIGVTVAVQGTALGAMTDLDGYFRVEKVPAGNYDLKITSIGYNEVIIIEVAVTVEDPVEINVGLDAVLYEMQTIRVKAKAVQNTEASMLKIRQRSSNISDGISAEQISRSGSGDAAEAMTKVTGASVVGGKYVYVRGLGDRYSNTQLNNSPLPSPDPDKQSVPMDLIPSGLLDNIIIEKTFTPDKPGNFAGGSVNLSTKDYPERRSLKVSLSSGLSSNTQPKDRYIGYDGGEKDWVGYDDGTRDLPDYVQDHPELRDEVPSVSFLNVPADSLSYYLPLINYMDSAAKSFNQEMQPTRKNPPLNQSHSISYGDLYYLFEKPLGVVGSFSYSRKYSSYSDGFSGKYKLGGAGASDLTIDHEMNDWVGRQEVLWGGLLNLKYGIHPNHKLGLGYMYTRNGESMSRLMEGISLEHLDSGQTLRTRTLSYSERKLNTLQFNGEHKLGKSIRVEWQVSSSSTSQSEPDIRYFTDQVAPYQYEDDAGNLIDTVSYDINPSRFPRPQRLWRNLDEDSKEYKLDVMVPIGRAIRIKTGTSYLKKDRVHTEERFEYSQYGNYDGNVDTYVSDVGVDYIDTIVFDDGDPVTNDTTFQYRFSNYLQDASEDRNQYSGEQKVFAAYSMINLPLTSSLKVVAGLRYETTDMLAESRDDSYEPGAIDDANILPSVNMVYAFDELMNLRLAYGRTLARPTLREMSPFSSEEFGVSRYLIGNIDLDYTLIDNYDLRWEWFVRPGEIMAVSGFYKRFKDPIEMSIIGANGNLQPLNVGRGRVTGLELEFRRRLDYVADFLRNFSLGGNLTLVHSEVDIPKDEMVYLKDIDPDANSKRPMHGQSPYLINLDLDYKSSGTGTTVSVFYNRFGERFAFNATNGTPDVYEQPRNIIDLLITQKFLAGSVLKFSIKNLLADDVLFVHEDIGLSEAGQKVYERHSTERSVSLGVTYQVW